MAPNISRKEYTMCEFNFQFTMHNSATDILKTNTGADTAHFIRCKILNSAVMFNVPNYLAYLYQMD